MAEKERTVKVIGVSNFNQGFYLNFIRSCEIIPAVNQVENHAFFQQEELRVCLNAHDTVMQAWSPLAAGGYGLLENKTLREIGAQYGKSAAQVAIRFLIQRGIPTIPKSARKDHLAENINVFDFQLSKTDMSRLAALDGGRTLFGWY